MHADGWCEKSEQSLLPLIVHRFSEVTIRTALVNGADERSGARAAPVAERRPNLARRFIAGIGWRFTVCPGATPERVRRRAATRSTRWGDPWARSATANIDGR